MNRQDFNTVKEGDKPSSSQHNRLTKTVSGLSNSMFTQGFTDSSGHHTRRGVGGGASANRLAFCKDDAGATTDIDCYLDVDGTGAIVNVEFSIGSHGTRCDLALPRLEDGDWIIVTQTSDGIWRCTSTLTQCKACTC